MICPICDTGKLVKQDNFLTIGALPPVTVETWSCPECGTIRETQTRQGEMIDEQFHRPKGDPRFARYHRQ